LDGTLKFVSTWIDWLARIDPPGRGVDAGRFTADTRLSDHR
jgi:hypothetical protein